MLESTSRQKIAVIVFISSSYLSFGSQRESLRRPSKMTDRTLLDHSTFPMSYWLFG